MSSERFDRHVVCPTCRGKACNLRDRCSECSSWTNRTMTAYVRHQRELEVKRLSKARLAGNRFLETEASPQPGPRPNPADDVEVIRVGSGDSVQVTLSSSISATDNIPDFSIAGASTLPEVGLGLG